MCILNNKIFEEMSGKRQIMVTGIAGFVGQNLNLYLADDFDVIEISRTKTSNRPIIITLVSKYKLYFLTF